MLQIPDAGERALVRTADAVLAVASTFARPFSRRPASAEPQRILLLRLERIGDLVMALAAIRDVRALAPSAQIDLVVGSWNAPLARAVSNVDRVETLDARWLAREGEGLGMGGLLRTAWSWRARRYDLAINFEPDVRSNLIAAAVGAARTAGWVSGGGGPVLDLSLDYDPTVHTSANARRLVQSVFGRTPPESARPLLTIPDVATAAAIEILKPALGRPLVGVHVSGGRAIKQWDPERFADVAARLADARGAAIVATGGPGDRALVSALQRALAPRPMIDATAGDGLLVSAAILARLDVLVTGDTGPMHLAAAVGTPVVAVFGPSDPARYATTNAFDRVVRIDLPCSPCNRIRRPPERCIGHTPDCLAGHHGGGGICRHGLGARCVSCSSVPCQPYMTDAVFAIEREDGRHEVHLETYLDAVSEERATADAIAWIKGLRHARVEGVQLRRRFTFRDDSLWWFAELYLHKQQVISTLFRALTALESLVERERPRALHFVRGGAIVQGLAPQVAAASNIAYHGRRGFRGSSTLRLAAMEARASGLNAAALASRLRTRVAPPAKTRAAAVAFVHRAFWRADIGDGSAEAYIGPVLSALERTLDEGALAYVSVGPASNFRARRWWHPLRGGPSPATAHPVEAYAPLGKLAASRAVWRERHRMRRALWTSDDLRAHSVIRHCDCWPIVREELAGIALLQWPWSARAMDEAAAALDACRPRVVVTYAEAGGWGRAIVLESRRRGIPSVGLQHGFIYRHWLNYLHEPDEITTDPEHAADSGFPSPTLTLLFDEYAARHLTEKGRFRPDALAVTGSPRLDALVSDVARLTTPEIERTREIAGTEGRTLVLVTAKHREAYRVLGTFLDAASTLSDVHVVIKAHPAETPEVYAALVAGRPHVTVLPASALLAPLLRASRAVVTVNSTVALDAAVLGVPALVIGLPNNLSPFVEAGVMAGVAGTDVAETARALHRILYHEEFRRELELAQRAFLTRFNLVADGRAAARAAEAIVKLARPSTSGFASDVTSDFTSNFRLPT